MQIALRRNRIYDRTMLSTTSVWKRIKQNRECYLIILLPFLYLLIFKYVPMYGAQIAFKRFNPMKGIWGSPWVGFDNFTRFFRSYYFVNLLVNTLRLSIYQLLAGFPFPILLALSLNIVRHKGFKKTVQMVTYAPHFISTVIIVGILFQILSIRGPVNRLLESIGLETVSFFGSADIFPSLYVWSGIWQNIGFQSIIYLAVLSGVDPELHEAAVIDGATLRQRTWHIDLPSVIPTAVILLILATGRIMEVGFEKALLMQTPLNLSTSEIIQTYVYKIGIASPTTNHGYPTAIGLFRSAIGLFLILSVNQASKRLSQYSLW